MSEHSKRLALALLLWLECADASAFTLEQVRGYAFPSGLVAAQKASKIAWIVHDQGRRNVWVAQGPEFNPRPLTSYSNDDGQEISSLALSANGDHVVFVRGGDHGSNWDADLAVNALSHPAGARVEIWSIPFKGGVARRLADGDYPIISPDNRRLVYRKDNGTWTVPLEGSAESRPLFNIRGRADSFQWSPDGSRLAFVSSRGSHAFIGVFTDEHTPILWLAPSTARDAAPRWSPDGKRIAFVRLRGAGGAPVPVLDTQPRPWSLWIADTSTGEAHRRWSSGTTLRDSYTAGYFDWVSGDRFVFQSYRDGWPHLYTLSDSDREPVLLTPGDFAVEDVVASPGRQELLFSANTGESPDDIDRRHIFRVRADRPGMQAITTGSGLEWSPVMTADKRVGLIHAGAQHPPAPAVLSPDGSNVHSLTIPTLSPDFPVEQLIIPKAVRFKSEDGVMVHGQLFAAGDGNKRGAGKRPAVVYMHGGPRRQMLLGWHPMGYYSNDYAVNQYLASQGFVVLAVNYRLGVGYGYAFQFPTDAGFRGAAEYRDIQAAGRYLKGLTQVDQKCIGLYGGSYGGYLTAMGLAHDSDLFAAGVDIHGVHDFTAEDDLASVFVRKRFEMPPDAERAVQIAWNASPVAAMATWKSPVLLIHGDDDRNVEFTQTIDLARRLEAGGVPYETLVLVDETHGILRYENVLRMNRAIVEYLGRMLCNGKSQ